LGRAAPFYRNYVWLHGYAATVDTDEDAHEAIDALPSYGGAVPVYTPNAGPVSIGWVYFLAGRANEALPFLRSAARSCTGLREPIAHVRAHHQLGRALEAIGDREAACREYELVLDRWGKARPESVTAEQTKARVRSLKCAGR
jgi:serine/threonine-protein kinase